MSIETRPDRRLESERNHYREHGETDPETEGRALADTLQSEEARMTGVQELGPSFHGCIPVDGGTYYSRGLQACMTMRRTHSVQTASGTAF